MTGKTRISMQIWQKYERKKIAVLPDNEDSWFNNVPDISRATGKEAKMIFEKKYYNFILNEFKNGLLVFDDFRNVFPSDRDHDLRSFLRRRRQKRLDVIFSCHSPLEFPPSYWDYIQRMVILPCSSLTASQMGNRPSANEISEAIQAARATKKPQTVILNDFA